VEARLAVTFEMTGEISQIEAIAIGESIREITRLPKAYGT